MVKYILSMMLLFKSFLKSYDHSFIDSLDGWNSNISLLSKYISILFEVYTNLSASLRSRETDSSLLMCNLLAKISNITRYSPIKPFHFTRHFSLLNNFLLIFLLDLLLAKLSPFMTIGLNSYDFYFNE